MGISSLPADKIYSITPSPQYGVVPSGITLRHTITSSTSSISYVGNPTVVYVIAVGKGGNGAASTSATANYTTTAAGGGGGAVFMGWATPNSTASIATAGVSGSTTRFGAIYCANGGDGINGSTTEVASQGYFGAGSGGNAGAGPSAGYSNVITQTSIATYGNLSFSGGMGATTYSPLGIPGTSGGGGAGYGSTGANGATVPTGGAGIVGGGAGSVTTASGTTTGAAGGAGIFYAGGAGITGSAAALGGGGGGGLLAAGSSASTSNGGNGGSGGGGGGAAALSGSTPGTGGDGCILIYY